MRAGERLLGGLSLCYSTAGVNDLTAIYCPFCVLTCSRQFKLTAICRVANAD